MSFDNYRVFAAGTETVPGLFCRYRDDLAIDRIYSIKNRDREKKLMLITDTFEKIQSLFEVNDFILDFVGKYANLQVSFLLPLKREVRDTLNKNLYSEDYYTGFRVTKHPDLLDLIDHIGVLAQTSLNISGERPILQSSLLPSTLANQIDFVFEFDLDANSVPSTIAKLFPAHYEIIRQGAYFFPDLNK